METPLLLFQILVGQTEKLDYTWCVCVEESEAESCIYSIYLTSWINRPGIYV